MHPIHTSLSNEHGSGLTCVGFREFVCIIALSVGLLLTIYLPIELPSYLEYSKRRRPIFFLHYYCLLFVCRRRSADGIVVAVGAAVDSNYRFRKGHTPQ